MAELTKERLKALSNRENVGAICSDEISAMARQLLAGLEQEPVAYMVCNGRLYQDRAFLSFSTAQISVKDRNDGAEIKPLYAAPQLPQPAVVTPNYSRFLSNAMTAAGLLSHGKRDKALATSLSEFCVAERMRMDAPCRAAMLQGSEPVHDVDNTNRQFESLGCAEDTSRRFKCTGLIVTSDERKMEIPRCSKHPETELQVHPFEQLLSHPPQPVMYCPLCSPSVAEWVALDKKLRAR